MDFTFPKNKTLYYGNIFNFIKSDDKIKFIELDITNPLDNTITIDNNDYYYKYLNDSPKNKGGNSIILELYLNQNVDIDIENIKYNKPDFALKILKFKRSNNPKYPNKSEKRFLKEIDALKKSYDTNSQNIIELIQSGSCKIWSAYNNKYSDYLFYIMEYADSDLKNFIESNHSTMELEQKVSLCVSLANGINELKDNGYYHRDIKPDNIFIVGDNWKIGDLGLIGERDSATTLDNIDEFIGPRGWISPEAMNKHLTGGKKFTYDCDVTIDHQSDIFQLGKVFWYIFQHNAPTGTVKLNDFKIKNKKLYPIIKTMLNYSKSKRYSHINEIIHLLKPIEEELLTNPPKY